MLTSLQFLLMWLYYLFLSSSWSKVQIYHHHEIYHCFNIKLSFTLVLLKRLMDFGLYFTIVTYIFIIAKSRANSLEVNTKNNSHLLIRSKREKLFLFALSSSLSKKKLLTSLLYFLWTLFLMWKLNWSWFYFIFPFS